MTREDLMRYADEMEEAKADARQARKEGDYDHAASCDEEIKRLRAAMYLGEGE